VLTKIKKEKALEKLEEYSKIVDKLIKIGHKGKVYAADIHKLAIREIQKKASMRKHNNIQTILTECNTQLLAASIDDVLLFYVLHEFKNPDMIIKELNRVLKTSGASVRNRS
jgi:ubiquinone/menaquinone biosynthesis C-methylase UbiE